MIAVWYDPASPGLYITGMGQVFPPRTLTATLNGDGTLEVWIAGQTARILGPVAFGLITDSAGNGFASAALARAYLDGEFGKTPVAPSAFVFSVAAAVWTMAHNLGRNPSVQLLTPGGLTMIGEVLHLSANVVQASFDAPQTGSAIII